MMVYFSEPIGDDYISSTNGLDGMMPFIDTKYAF